MEKYLVIFKDEYNGIELEGFTVMTDIDVDVYEDLASSITWPFTYQSGEVTLEYNDGEDLLDKMEFKSIYPEAAKHISDEFSAFFGFFISEYALREIIGDELEGSDDFGNDDDDYDDED